MHALLSSILSAFSIPGEILTYDTPSDGNINKTYRVSLRHNGEVRRYVVQGINQYVFPRPDHVMENIRLVTAHLRKKEPERTVLHFYETADGALLTAAGGEVWRVCDLIPSVTHSGRPSPMAAEQAGTAFGHFGMLLSDLDPKGLHEIIPGFHDTVSRYQALHHAAAADPLGRAAEVQEELQRLLALEEVACTLTRLQQQGALPLRVTHNDTKISNILFDPTGEHPVAVIDLDTVMPGLLAHDYGDAIRSAANQSAAEDDLRGARMDERILEAFTAGFLRETGTVLSAMERETLYLAPIVMTAETAVRFLSDYLMGDPYFRPRYPGHNLQRARMQMRLAEDLFARRAEIAAIIRKYLP